MSNVLFHQIKDDKAALLVSIGADAASEADVDRLKTALNGQHGNGVLIKVPAWAQRADPQLQSVIYENREGAWLQGPLAPEDRRRTGIYLGYGFAIVTAD